MARKKERGNGTGTVYPRKNKQGKIIGYRGAYHSPDGTRRYVSAKKKSDAERLLRQAMTDAERGLVFDAGTVTVEAYLDRWLMDSVKDTPCAAQPSPSTRAWSTATSPLRWGGSSSRL